MGNKLPNRFQFVVDGSDKIFTGKVDCVGFDFNNEFLVVAWIDDYGYIQSTTYKLSMAEEFVKDGKWSITKIIQGGF